MARVTVKQSELSVGDSVELTLGGTTIVGEVIETTNRGSSVVKIEGNLNKVTVTSRTNFKITKEVVDPDAATREILDDLEVGEQFEYYNKYGKIFTWVKTGEDRYTKVDSGRPAVSFSAKGFPVAENITVL